MKEKITTLLLLLLVALYGYGEDIKKQKYGKVSMEELTMTRYEKDTSADAIVLYTYGEFNPNIFCFTNHVKIKVIKQTGSSKANMAFAGRLKNRLKGCSYNLENGEIMKNQLKKESIFEEKVYGNRYVTRVAIPNVKAGTVFEVEYTLEGIPNAFDFQDNIPVVYAALSFPPNTNFDIKTQELGMLGFAYRDATTWIAKDMPAFKSEPFMRSRNDYKVRIEFELASIITPRFIHTFSNSWNSVTSAYMSNQDFGVMLARLNLCLNEMVDSVKANSKTDKERLINAYNIIKRQIRWDKQESCYCSQPFEKTLKLKSGNTADINLMLVALLRKLDITCHPVLLSTRANGRISRYFPTIEKFNYVIASASVENTTYYLDASQQYLPFNMIPEDLIGCNGHIVNSNLKEGQSLVTLESPNKEKQTTINMIKIDSTGRTNGSIIIAHDDYNAIDFKEKLKSYTDHDAYIEQLESDNSGIKINSFKLSDVNDLTKPIKEEYEISISNADPSILLINPIVFPEINKNPFTQEKRTTPLSFSQAIDYTTIINIALPTNYKIEEAPKSTVFTSPDNSVKYSYKIDYNNSQVNIRVKFTLDKLDFSLSEYGIIRQIFELMAQKQSESIILKKI